MNKTQLVSFFVCRRQLRTVLEFKAMHVRYDGKELNEDHMS